MTVAGLMATPLLGCGGDREERGLSPAIEEAVPMDPKEMDMTEAERKAKQAAKLAEDEAKGFDADAGGS
jgi:hypothetical protein